MQLCNNNSERDSFDEWSARENDKNKEETKKKQKIDDVNNYYKILSFFLNNEINLSMIAIEIIFIFLSNLVALRKTKNPQQINIC